MLCLRIVPLIELHCIKCAKHLPAHCVRPTTIGVMSVSFILLSLDLRGTQLQPELLCSMTGTRTVPIKQPKLFKGMPVVIIQGYS